MNRTLFYSFVGLTLSFGFVCAYADKPNGGINDTCFSAAFACAVGESNVDMAKSGVVDHAQTTEQADFPIQQVEDPVFDVVEQQPSFPGGPAVLQKWLRENVKYPAIAVENKIGGRVIVEFIVCKDGSISGAKVIRSVDPSLDKEAVRVISSMPRWTPGRQNGDVVNVRYTLPVTFYLPD